MRASAQDLSMAERSTSASRRLGEILLNARVDQSMRLADLSALAGLSSGWLSRMERGRGASASLEAWESALSAAGLELDVRPVAGTESTLRSLAWSRRCLRVVVDLAGRGGWLSHAEIEAHSSGFTHGVCVRLTRPDRREIVIVSIRDLIPSADQAIAHLDAMLHDARREFDGWLVVGMLVLEAGTANRRAISERHELVSRRFPRSGSALIGALRMPAYRLPREDSLVWAVQGPTRLIPNGLYRSRHRPSRAGCPSRAG